MRVTGSRSCSERRIHAARKLGALLGLFACLDWLGLSGLGSAQLIPLPQAGQEMTLGSEQPQSRVEPEAKGAIEGSSSAVRKVPGGQALLKAVKPSEYLLGPGDGLILNVWGRFQAVYMLTVYADGKIVIPTVGSLYVNGLSLEKTQSLVADAVKPYYQDVHSSLSLTVLRVFEVRVVGGVRKPENYLATAVSRVSDLIEQASGILETGGSQRQIQLKREGKVQVVDLVAFRVAGREEDNPLVRDGDIIIVPLRGPQIIAVNETRFQVAGTGAVNVVPTRQILEVKEGELLSSLPSRLGGIDSMWDLKRASLEREQPGSAKRASIPIDLERLWIKRDLKIDLMLQSGDELTIPAIENRVSVFGEIKNSGVFNHNSYWMAGDYIAFAGGPTVRADLEKAYVTRLDGTQIPIKENPLIQVGDTIMVPQKTHLLLAEYAPILQTLFFAVFAIVAGLSIGK